MPKYTKKKLKVVATLASVALFATAFTPGGCTLNIDQDLLNQLGGLFGSGQGHFDGDGHHNGNDGNHNDGDHNDGDHNDDNGNDNDDS